MAAHEVMSGMQVEVEASGALERRMRVQVPAAEVDREIENRLRTYGKRVKLKGFRPGKIPLNVIRRQFGNQIRAEVVEQIVRTSFAQAVGREKLAPAGGPRIEPQNLEPGKDLEYTAIFEVYPTVELKGLDELKVEKPTAEITEADVDAVIENLRQQRLDWRDVDAPAATNMRVIVDLAGSRNGEPVANASGEGIPIVLGSGRMPPQFDAALAGARAGETRGFDVDAPAGAGQPDAGPLHFEATVRAVQEPVLPEVDENFCASFGIEEGGVPKLREDVRANMARELAQTVRARMKAQVLEQLHAANAIDVPRALVEDEITNLQRDAGVRLGIMDSSKLPARSMFEQQAHRRVALGLLMNEIIKQQGIMVDRARVEQRLEEIAADYQDPAAVIRAYRADPQLMRSVESLVLEDQAVEWLLERAETTERALPFAELMKLDKPSA
jgi:trigger factor